MSVWQANEEQFLEMRQRIAELEEKNLQLKADVADAVHLLVQAEAELAALKDVITVLAEMAAEAADPMQPNAPPADWIGEAKRRVASFPVARAEEGSGDG